jgi:enhanced entry protein EnhC
MKLLMPWVCMVAACGIPAVYANDGVDAYRKGQYFKAAESFNKQSHQDPVVQYYMGRMRLYGYGELKNNALALEHFKAAGEKGHLDAQNLLARYELLVDNNPEKALYWFKKAAGNDDLQAQMYTAAAYLYGYGTSKNPDRARRYYIAAAKKDNPLAQYTLAEHFLDSRHSQNRKLGVIWLDKAADSGFLKAQIKQGELYATGRSVDKDVDKARKLFNLAIDKGSVDAMYQMGQLELQLNQTNQAIGWLEKAANEDYVPAQVALAAVYLKENTPEYNPNTGFLWMLKAAQHDSKQAQLQLSSLYEKGIGVDKDENLAKVWKDKSTEKAGKSDTNPGVEAVKWLTNDKLTDFAQSGYKLEGILSPWNNTNALKENNYNQSPQLDIVDRTSIYKPKFEVTHPNDVDISTYYNAIANTFNDAAAGKIEYPDYPMVKAREYLAQSGIATTNESQFQDMLNRAIVGDPTAQFYLAQMYDLGEGVDKSTEKALEYYQLAADQGDLKSIYALALINLKDQGIKPDYEQAEILLKEAAFKGSPQAQYVLAELKENGLKDKEGKLVIKPDNNESMAMYYLAASNEYGDAQYRLAELLVRQKEVDRNVLATQKRNALIKKLYAGAVSKGITRAELPLAFFNAMSSDANKQAQAFKTAKQEAENGSEQGALLVGLMLDRGIGVPKNDSEAIYWYQKATNNPAGAFILGSYLASGQNVSQDEQAGKVFLQKSADGGFSYGNLNVAIMNYKQGQTFLPELTKAMELGNSKAGLLLADYYLSLGNDPEKMKEAKSIYQSFAEKGDKDAQMKLAFMNEKGLGGKVNLAQATEWYKKAAEQNQPQAKYLLARLYFLGEIGQKPDYAKAKYLMKNATAYYAPAAVGLGFIYDTVDDNYQQALTAYQLAANQQDPIGQYNLGLMYELGKGVPVDYNKAQALYEQSATKHHTKAMVQLAGIYFNGLAGSRDEEKAMELYKKAAQKGDREALYQLGLMSETGVGTDLNINKAIDYYQRSAKKENTKASLALARIYQYGQGVNKDSKKAFDIYEALAKQHNPYAQFQLATFYYEGINGKPSAKLGKAYLLKAQKNGYGQAGNVLQRLDAQSEGRISYLTPIRMTADIDYVGQPADLMFLDAMNQWNRGDEILSRMILDKILFQFPHFKPAKRAYDQLHQTIIRNQFS